MEFGEPDQFISSAPIVDERCLNRARWILGVRSDLAESQIMRLVPQLVKVCSARGVASLVRRALPGLELLHVPVTPSAMSARADMVYFSIGTGSATPCWQDIQGTREVGVYIPGELGRAVFEVTVIIETNA